MACSNCSDGLHWECSKISDATCCCCKMVGDTVGQAIANAPVQFIEGSWAEEDDTRHSYRTYKRDSTLKDQQSTGRKRAAKMYPLDATQPCEWQGLRFAGGGRFPIVGCTNGTQQARHHGPDKNTLNNDKGNVHRICAVCHNRWHTLNDLGYTPDDALLKHDPDTKATVEEIVANIAFWANRKLVKAKD